MTIRLSHPIINNELNLVLKRFIHNEPGVGISIDTAKWSLKAGLAAVVHDYAVVNTKDVLLNQELQATKLTLQFWFQIQLNAIKTIVGELNQVGIRPTLLKGISISTSHYPRSFYRTMRDIDLLVDKDEILESEQILANLGFVQESNYSPQFYDTHHHTMPWKHTSDDIWIEVHSKLFPNTSSCSNSFVFSLDSLKSEKIKDDFYGLDIYRFSKEYQIVYIAAHWAENFKQVGSLFAFLDVALLINDDPEDIDWDKIVLWTKGLPLTNYIFLLLHSLNHYDLLKDNINIEKYICKLKPSVSSLSMTILLKIIDNYLYEGKAFGRVLTLNNISTLWDHLLSPSSRYLKIAMIPIVIIFPKGKVNIFDYTLHFSRLKTFFGFRKSS